MRIEIDQSNKVEETAKDSIIGASNGVSFAVVIPARVKRKLQEVFRKKGRQGVFVYRTFMAGIVLLLKRHQVGDLGNIVIDVEYWGRERMLTSIFFEMWSRVSEQMVSIEFKQIGKHSDAHATSYAVVKGKRKPDYVIRYEEIVKLVLK